MCDNNPPELNIVLKKLAIVGAEPLTRDNAPWDDQEYEIWVFNEWATQEWCKRFDAVLQMHTKDVYQNVYNKRSPGYWDWLKSKRGKPVYMQDVDPDVPDSKKYPLDKVLTLLENVKTKGVKPKPLNSTVAYAISLGILQDYNVIDIYGVEMSNSSEYHSQQPLFAFWVGLAAGKGIQLNVNCTQGLFVQPLYGYEDMRQNEKLHGYINGLKEQQAEAQKQANMIEGALTLARQLLDG